MALSLLCVMVGLASAGQDSGRIAVVNVPRVSEQYLRTGQLEQRFEEQRRKYNQERETRKAEYEKLARSLEEQFKPGTADYEERREQLLVLKYRFETFVQTEEAKLETDMTNSLRSIYEDITQMVGRVAEEKGIDLVLPIEPFPDETPESSTVFRQRVMLQKVIYASPRLDITEEVLRRLNQEYKQSGAKTPSGSAAPDASLREETDRTLSVDAERR